MKSVNQEIIREAKGFLPEYFSEYIVYSCFTGSAVYGGAIPEQSDLDWFIVVNSLFSEESMETQNFLRDKFTDFYYYLNKKYNFKPDDEWPGEIVTLEDMEKSLSGIGAHVNIREVMNGTSEYHENDQIVSYFYWLCYSAMSQFVIGDRAIFEENKQRAWNEIVRYSSKTVQFEPKNLSQVLDLVKGKVDSRIYFGWKARYTDFDNKEEKYLRTSLSQQLNIGIHQT